MIWGGMLRMRFLTVWFLAGIFTSCAGGNDPVEPSRTAYIETRDASVPTACTLDRDCAGGETCVRGACVIASASECIVDDDCPRGTVCREDACVPSSGCMTDADCPQGSRCRDTICQDAPPVACVEDQDCAENETCREGACAVAEPQCRADDDCQPGQRCAEGQCVGDGMGGCAADEDCPAGQLCRAGVCIGPRPQCDEDDDCRMGQVCTDSRCVDVPSCQVDGDCQPGQRCDDGTCVEIMEAQCRDNSDCPGAQTCQGGMCVGPGAGCVDAGDCAPGERCVDGDCLPPDGACQNDQDCPRGSMCVNGNCVAGMVECQADADCADGQFCEEQRCQDVALDPPAACDSAIRGGLGMYDGMTMGESRVRGGCGLTENSPEAVYSLSFAADGAVCLSTAGSDFDTVLYVRSECRAPASQLECNDDNADVAGGAQSALTLNTEVGETYYAFVDGYGLGDGGEAGAYQLSVTEGPCMGDEDPDPDPEPDEVPPGCLGVPPVIDVGESVNGTTAGESTATGQCRSADGPEAIYQMQVLGGGNVCLNTEGSDFDTVLYVRTDCGVSASEVACNDDFNGLQSSVTFDAELGTTYFIFVDGYGLAGDYVLNAVEGPCPE